MAYMPTDAKTRPFKKTFGLIICAFEKKRLILRSISQSLAGHAACVYCE